MSERIRKAAGLILLALCVLLIIAPLLRPAVKDARYRTAENRIWIPETIRTAEQGTVRINDADADALRSLPGIGPAYAERIITERQKNGPFFYPEDLETVSGIGPQILNGFRTMLDMTLDEGGN